MKKADINFWTDAGIGVAFTASAVSGLLFLLPISADSVLGVSFQSWSTVHTWSSLLVVAGVIAHLALHWKWVVAMTRKTLAARWQPAATRVAPAVVFGQPAAIPVRPADDGIGRRDFLRYAVLGAGAVGIGAVSAHFLRDDNAAEASATASTDETPWSGAVPTNATSGRLTVACRKGVTYCPYPGRCHSFRDRDGDGYCDLSIPT